MEPTSLGSGNRICTVVFVDIVQYSREWCADDGDCGRRSFTDLTWQRTDDMWVRILGDGRYRSADRLLAVAESIVDRPQPATLRMGLAPAGWSVQFFKMGRVLTLVNLAASYMIGL